MCNICGLGQKIYSQPPMSRSYEESVYARLKGKFTHYRYEWDVMAIDEACAEFEACLCFNR